MLKNQEKYFQMMFKDMGKCLRFSMNWGIKDDLV